MPQPCSRGGHHLNVDMLSKGDMEAETQREQCAGRTEILGNEGEPYVDFTDRKSLFENSSDCSG